MTEKQWKIIDEEFISYTGGTAQLISNEECKIHLWERPKDAQLFCDKLNAINEENEQLKQDNTNLHRAMSKDRVNYLKFRDKVFDLIDKKIKEVDTIGAEVLKDLRRELIE